MSKHGEIVLARHAAGAIDRAAELNALVAGAWSELLADEADAQRVASEWAVTVGDLRRVPSPIVARVSASGLTGAEILIAFTDAFLIGAAVEVGKRSGAASAKVASDAAKQTWRILRRRVMKIAPDALGPEAE